MVKKKKKESEKEKESKKTVKSSNDSTEQEEIKEPGIHELKALVEAEKDRTLRLFAEFENYKKRTAKESLDFKKFANETLLKQLLSVVGVLNSNPSESFLLTS